jgi:hypothetical protein
MAGDWIKMRLSLQTHPKIVRILSATKSDKFRAIGGLHAVWSVFDTHSVDGKLYGYTPEALDHIIGWPGFSGAMIEAEWLLFDGAETLMLPDFDEHNGASGKRRAEDQKRKRDSRKSPKDVTDNCGQNADKMRTREEKRREDSKPIKTSSEHSPDGEEDGQDDDRRGEDRRSDSRKKGDPKDYEAARVMFDMVLGVNATAKTPNWDAWANDIRKMREIDKRKRSEICELFQWAKLDHFWASNIQSPATLRKQWDRLVERRAAPAPVAKTGPQGTKWNLTGIDHTSSREAMEEGMRKAGTVVPDLDVDIKF